MSNQVYQLKSKVKITDTFSRHYGSDGIIINYSSQTDKYLIEVEDGLSKMGTTYYSNEWFDLEDFYPVSGPPANPIWNVSGGGSSGIVKIPSTGIDAKWGNIVPSSHKCRHSWKMTQLPISQVFDCTKCGMKKEDYDKEDNDDFGVPF